MIKFLIALATFVGSLFIFSACAPVVSKMAVMSVFSIPLSVGFLGALFLAGCVFFKGKF